MRTTLVLLVIAAIVVPTAGAGRRITPRLGIAEDPVAVRGVGFKPGEHVRVVLVAGGHFVRLVSATRAGRFVARFPRASMDRCSGYTASAVGSKGSRASLKVTRECPPSQPDVINPIDLTPKHP